MPRNVSVGALILVVVATVAALVVISLSKLRYLAELEPPARYNHPYDGPVDERVMPLAEVRAFCKSVGASGPL
jgi:hypothetical protein